VVNPQIKLHYNLYIGSLDDLVSDLATVVAVRDRLAALGIECLEGSEVEGPLLELDWLFAPEAFAAVAEVIEGLTLRYKRNDWVFAGRREIFAALEPRIGAFHYESPAIEHLVPDVDPRRA
jgi:hypothetical protein